MTQLIQEKLPEDVKMANSTKELLISLGMSFVVNLSDKANVFCNNHNKKTIVAEHVFEALHDQKQLYLLGPVIG
jgi:histone H3/H4